MACCRAGTWPIKIRPPWRTVQPPRARFVENSRNKHPNIDSFSVTILAFSQLRPKGVVSVMMASKVRVRKWVRDKVLQAWIFSRTGGCPTSHAASVVVKNPLRRGLLDARCSNLPACPQPSALPMSRDDIADVFA